MGNEQKNKQGTEEAQAPLFLGDGIRPTICFAFEVFFLSFCGMYLCVKICGPTKPESLAVFSNIHPRLRISHLQKREPILHLTMAGTADPKVSLVVSSPFLVKPFNVGLFGEYSMPLNQWEIQDPKISKMEVLYHIRPYMVGTSNLGSWNGHWLNHIYVP